MTVISPALVLAMCVMFILTRVHTVRFTFEHLFFFGLRYVVEPTRKQLASLAAAGLQGAVQAATTPGGRVKRGGAAAAAKRVKEASARPTLASLPVSRAVLTPAFFATDEDVPHLQEFDHLLATLVGYVGGVLFEEAATCFFPSMFAESHIWWLALFAGIFAAVESVRICAQLESATAPLCVGAVAGLSALALIAAGDRGHFVLFDAAFDAVESGAVETFTGRLGYGAESAAALGANVALLARIVVAVAAGAAVAAALFPALRFAQLDFALFADFVLSADARKRDPYALPARPMFGVLFVAADHLLSVIAVGMWALSGRDAGGMYRGMRVWVVLCCAGMRLLCARIRLQLHLDGAIDSFRTFWAERPVLGVVAAGDRLKYFVAHRAMHVTTIAMAGVASPVIAVALALSAKRSGAVSFGLCPIPAPAEPGNVFVREMAGFLAVAHLACYELFTVAGWAYLLATRALDPTRKLRQQKVAQPMTSSERRRRRRSMEAAAAGKSVD